jgi:hypothetical protein
MRVPHARAESGPRYRRAGALTALVVVAALAVLTARETTIGRREVAAADEAADRSDWPVAVGHARAAAEALAPGSPWPERGWHRLEAIGHDAEARGDDPTAMLAYGAMRAAALASGAPGSGSDRWRARAEEGLARVAASRHDLASPRVGADGMLDALRENEPPPAWRLALLAAAALAMLGGLARLAWLGGSEARRARVAQALAAAGAAAYAVSALLS